MKNVFLFVFLSCVSFLIQGMDQFEFSNANGFSHGIHVMYSTAIGKGTPMNQQDVLGCYSNESSWACGIFDGHGGEDIAQKLADLKNGLVPTILRGSPNLSSDSIKQGYVDYDDKNFSDYLMVGSTTVTFIIDLKKKKFFLSHCGDSGGILIAGTELLHQTIAHDAKNKNEVKRIQDANGFVKDNRVRLHSFALQPSIEVTRSFGDRIFKEGNGKKLIIPDPDVYEGELKHEPIVGVLFSDGFLNGFSQDSAKDKNFSVALKDIVCQLISMGRPIEGLAEDLIGLMRGGNETTSEIFNKIKKDTNWNTIKSKTNAAWSGDNVSLIVFWLSLSIEPQEGLVIFANNNSPSAGPSSHTFNRILLKVLQFKKIIFIAGGLLFAVILLYFGFVKQSIKKF